MAKTTNLIVLVLICVFTALLLCCEVSANRRVAYLQPCNRTNRCDSRASLACKNGKCACIVEDTMSYDSIYGRCSVHAGEKCIFTTVQGEKVEERSWREEMPCVLNAQCTEGFCTCFTGFFETPTGNCLVKRGIRDDCEQSNLACRDDEYLICTEEKVCDCNNTISTYDFSRQLCVRKANAPCNDLEICVAHAFCRDRRYAVYPSGVICQCEEGFFANAEGFCERKRGHGEPCLANNFCTNDEYTVNLICTSEGRCGCDSNISVYDESEKMCKRLAGAQCHGYRLCMENSECRPSGRYETETSEIMVCECNSGYFQSKDRLCKRRRVYGEECENDDNCQLDLKCNLKSGLCECDASSGVYDFVRGRCVGLANSSCEISQSCITNSECSWSRDDIKRCTCKDGYASSNNGSCLASHDMWCSDSWTHACNSERGLICKEGKCTCKYERFQTFNSELQKCVSRASGPCGDNIPCVNNSHCESNKSPSRRRCVCDSGFIEVDIGHCEITIGQRCNYTQSRNSENNLRIKCDSYAPLFCIEGTCQCDFLQYYDRDSSKCKGLTGAVCYTNVDDFCVEGATCDHHRFVNLLSRGLCKCKTGWISLDSGHCAKSNGTLTEEEDLINV